MERAAMKFCAEASEQKTRSGRWLSFVGNSGNGKTFLSEMIFKRVRAMQAFRNHVSLLKPCQRVFWPELVSELRSGEFHRVKELGDCHLVLLDEVVIEHDPTGFVKDRLCELLKRRARKWTILTSNLTLESIRTLDTRIASMMVRDGSAVVGCRAMDYAMRK
jgi:DNA replication protein DnaC